MKRYTLHSITQNHLSNSYEIKQYGIGWMVITKEKVETSVGYITVTVEYVTYCKELFDSTSFVVKSSSMEL